MPKLRRVHLLAAAAITTAVVIGSSTLGPTRPGVEEDQPEEQPAATQSDEDQMNAWIDETLGGMSLEEKVGQIFVTYAHGPTADGAHPDNVTEFGVETPAEVVQRYHLGGVVYFNWSDSFENPVQVAELSNGLQEAALSSGAEIPLVISTDQEQGVVTRFGEPATQFPGNMALGAGRSADDAREAAAITGQELRAVGINQDYAPVADVNVDPANPVIGVRSFSQDPALVSQLVTAQVEGYQDSAGREQTVSSAIKHFPGHGDTNQDSHESLPTIDHTLEEWRELDAPPFAAAIEAGADVVMTGHLLTPELDDSGMPATLSPDILTGLLRGELGFEGVISTDSLQMEGVREQHDDARIPVLALQAGVDQLLMPQDLGVAVEAVIEAVHSGELTEERIEESVRRVLKLKWNRGIISTPLVDVARVDELVGNDEHLATAQSITDRTTVALRNDSDLLPMETPESVLVTGPDASALSALAGSLAERGVEVQQLPTTTSPSETEIEEAVDSAADHDLAIALTNAAWNESKSGQLDLVRSLAESEVPLVAVATRDPYDAAYVDEATTWLATHSIGRQAMESLTKVVLGEIAPVGELAVTVPDPENPDTDRYPFGHGLTWSVPE
ncbi:glycoside hydrolase family 3 protein [Actinoalloteichus hymeniacidonis]|uniref:beta-N-acetylhexosaminidase n=1 Tax=Actinoalloteichus hymeniacidonis TaxID=340345 RepID=A0AAC9HL62_9PSEU|nr:glycoside hydrolase family 3 protein [Actinoalloteichus hymeniacidonis]AOS61128.1 beta-glucosidase-like glycosyl hydrolase [Actinoalloteichus hymeniacidonis]MBB5910871.1 beta-N-acetylhexosaminidase [Actinoalloteichus hymeniacidonis]